MIIGAGMAGLSAAIDVAASGERVLVVDAADVAGGKMSLIEVGGARIDNGPTVLTLRGVFDELFDDAGLDFSAAVNLVPADLLARHFWADAPPLDLFADQQQTEQAIAAFAGPEDARGYRRFADAGRRIYETLEQSFMHSSRPASPLSLLWRGGFAGLPGFFRLDPYRSLARMTAEHFRDPRLRQLFGRYATYCGSSPYRAPATLALVAHTEKAGVWRVEGGMARLAEAMTEAARRIGVDFRFGARVEAVTTNGGRASGVRLVGGETIAGRRTLLTADAAALAAGMFGPAAARGQRRFRTCDRSYSAVTAALVAKPAGRSLSHHNIFFSADARMEFAALEAARRPSDVTVYLCAQDRDASPHPAAPGGAERLFLVLNAPADGDTHHYSQAETERWTQAAMERLSRSGLTVEAGPAGISTSTPSEFERRFPATGGALYGRASHGWMASFRRPGARTRLPGLYLAGGSIHPGAGVPMAALSGRTAARAILADRASTSTFPRGATPGGISTPSARTAATASL